MPINRRNFSGTEGCLAGKRFAEGLKRAGAKPSRESLVPGLESIGRQSFEGFAASFSPTNHVASSGVEISMLTGDGRVCT